MTMFAIFWSLFVLSLLGLYQTVSRRSLCAGLTIRYSWAWSVVAMLVCCVSILASYTTTGHAADWFPPRWQLGLQYLSAILLLTPAVCTLGARRPGVSAWQWFVVLPLVFVLAWPVLVQLTTSHGRGTIQLSGPAITGFALVTLMSISPGLGGAMTVPALLYLSAVLLTIWPLTGWPFFSVPAGQVAVIPLVISGQLTNRQLKNRYQQISLATSEIHRLNAVWGLLQDLYGVVWPQRMMDRMKQFQQAERWCGCLTAEGFRKTDGTAWTPQELESPVKSFRWVLQRFADSDWIDQYVPLIREESQLPG